MLAEAILLVIGLLALALAARSLCRNLSIPYTVFLTTLGILLGWIARTRPEFEPLLRFQLTPELVLFLFLPALIFESALTLNPRQFAKDLGPIMTLAVPALFLSTAVIGLGLHWLFDMPLTHALLFGALISATDPVAVIALFRELGVPERLTLLVEGESLLNDAVAIVLFNILIGLALGGALGWSDIGLAAGEFFRVFLLGLVVGGLLAPALTYLFHRLHAGADAYALLSVILAYLSFILAEHYLHVSGVMAVAVAAPLFAFMLMIHAQQSVAQRIRELWHLVALAGNSLLFFLVGLSVDLGELFISLGAIIAAVALVLLGRAAAIYGLLPAIGHTFSLPRVARGEQHVLWWGGLKGGLSIAIALSIPAEMEQRSLLINMTVGVVLFFLLVNGTTIHLLIHGLGLDRLTREERAEQNRILQQVRQCCQGLLDRLFGAGAISRGAREFSWGMMRPLAEGEAHGGTSGEDVLHRKLVRRELQELRTLHDVGLLNTYTYLDLFSQMQSQRTGIVPLGEASAAETTEAPRSLVARLEATLLRCLRNRDTVVRLLEWYQDFRMANQICRDAASALICTAVLEMLEQEEKTSNAERRKRAGDRYRACRETHRERLSEIVRDSSRYYERFARRLSLRIALAAARNLLEDEHLHGGINDKAHARITGLLEKSAHSLRHTADPRHRLTPEELIRRIPLIEGLDPSVIEKLARQASVVNFLQGDQVIGSGERGDALYIVWSGRIGIYHGDVTDKRERTAVLHAGDFFGEVALLSGDRVRTASAVAETPATLLRLRRRDVREIAATEPALERRLREAEETRRPPAAAGR